METPPARSENIEVESSHCGMGHHPAVVYAVAERLAQPEGKWAPFDRSGWGSMGYPHARLWASVVVNPENALWFAHAAPAFPHHRTAQARTLAHRLHRYHGVRRCDRAARRFGLARDSA